MGIRIRKSPSLFAPFSFPPLFGPTRAYKRILHPGKPESGRSQGDKYKLFIAMVNSKDVSEVRRRVADRWSKIDYRSGNRLELQSDKEQSITADVIDLTKDSDEDDTEDRIEVVKHVRTSNPAGSIEQRCLEEEQAEHVQYPFRLIRSEIYDRNTPSSPHFISMEKILSDTKLKTCWLFSYQYELDYILPMFHENVNVRMVAQNGTILPLTNRDAVSSKLLANLQSFSVNMPPYTCHHSKMVINFYQDGSCQIFIPSNNFTQAETNIPQQIWWSSPQLPRTRTNERNKSKFKSQLKTYLDSYPCNLGSLKKSVDEVDFANLDNTNTQFVYSTPTKRKDIVSGFRLIYNSLKDESLIPSLGLANREQHYLVQTSSIGGPLRVPSIGAPNLFTHLMVPLFSGLLPIPDRLTPTDHIKNMLQTSRLKQEFRRNKIHAYILYPTLDEIRTSPLGYHSAGWFHFNWARNDANKRHYKTLTSLGVLYKQTPGTMSSSRGTTPSHSKFYLKSTAKSSFKTLDWCLFTTSNVSGHAWGTNIRGPQNYEVGVLLFSDSNKVLVPKSAKELIYKPGRTLGNSNTPSDEEDGRQKVIVTVPFGLPPTKYSADDESFCFGKKYAQTDIQGRVHSGY